MPNSPGQSRSKRNASRKRGSIPPNKAKGNLVEEITARIHRLTGQHVEKNVMLPPFHRPGKKREIDVLLSSIVSGYPIRLAFECKNEKHPVGISLVADFADKLDDVGIPPQCGIMVSASGYTRDAIGRGKQLQIRLLHLTGLTDDRLSASVHEAFQSHIYILFSAEKFKIVSDAPRMDGDRDDVIVMDSDGTQHHPFDLIWEACMKDPQYHTLGAHELVLKNSPERRIVCVRQNGTIYSVLSICTNVRTLAHLFTFPGKGNRFDLLNAIERKSEKTLVELDFRETRGQFNSIAFDSEEGLRNYLARVSGLSVVVGRILIPRMLIVSAYWPPTANGLAHIANVTAQKQAGTPFDPKDADFAKIEGTNIESALAPLPERYCRILNEK